METKTLYKIVHFYEHIYACADTSVSPQDLPIGFLMYRPQCLPVCIPQPWAGKDLCLMFLLHVIGAGVGGTLGRDSLSLDAQGGGGRYSFDELS